MGGRRFLVKIAVAVGVRPAEGAIALLFFFYFFLITAPFSIIKSVRDASYLDDIGVQGLPWAYATAILVAAAVALHARLQSRLPRRLLLIGSLIVFAATALLFRLFFSLPWSGVTLLFWLWANIFVVVLTTQFWFLVNDLFNPREAKRLIGFLGSGGILGGIAGGVLTGFLARPGRPEDLLFAAAGLLGAGAVVVAVLFRRLERGPGASRLRATGPSPAEKAGLADSFRIVRGDSYLRLLAGLALLAGIVSTFIDWQSKAVIDGVPAAKANLASFFGQFNAGLLALAFLFQIVLTSRFLGRFGLRLGLMVYPAALLLVSGGVGVWPVLGWALAVKGADKAFSYSIHQSSRELLFIPVPAERKYRAKVFIDMFLNRISKTVGAALLLLLFLTPWGRDVRVVSVASALLIAVWLTLNVKLGRAYGKAVTARLRGKWERGEGLLAESADAETAQWLVDTLDSQRRSPSLYALRLYERAREGRLTPDIQRFLEEENATPTAALSHPLLDGEEIPWPAREKVDFLSVDADVREILNLPDYQRIMGEYADRLLHGENAGIETEKMELAKAAGLMDPGAPLADRIEDLLGDGSPEVVHYAAEAAGKLRRRESVARLAGLLGDPRFRGDAEAALIRYGGMIAGTLGDFLFDPGEPPEVRRRIAAVLAELPAPDAAVTLLDALLEGRAGIDRDVIDALDRIRGRHPDMAFDEKAVRAALDREISRLANSGGRAESLWLFRLIGLIRKHDDITRAGQCFVRGTKDEEAFALELLDHVLPLDLKERILPVLEHLPRPEGER